MEQLNDIKLALRSTTSSNCTVTMTTHREQLVPVKPKPAHFKLIGLTILLCIVIIISVFGNSFALIAFRISRKLRSVTNYFIINLCIADLCVALLSMPFWISFLLTGWPNKKSRAVYSIWICLDIFYGTWSIMSLAVMSIERYVCIIYPLRYKSMVTKRRAWLAVAFVLVYAAFTSCLGYVQISLNESMVAVGIFVFAYVIPVLIKMFTYRKIYKEARRQCQFMMQEERDRQRLYPQETVTTDSRIVRSLSGNKRGKQACRRKRSPQRSPRSQFSSRDSLGQNIPGNQSQFVCSYVQEKSASCSFVKDDPSNIFRVYWRKCTSEARQRFNIQSCREKPMLEEIRRKSSRESECKKNEMLLKDGIEDWIDDLESKEPIEYMDSRSDEIECSLEIEQSSEAKCFTKKSNEILEENTSHSMQTDQEKKKTIKNPQYPLKSTTESTQGLKAIRRCRTSTPSESKSIKLFRSQRLAQRKLNCMVRLRRLNKELKAAKIIGAIIGTFLVLWTPFMMVVILAAVNVPISMNTVIIAKCLHYANSAVNPILYVMLNSKFRTAASSMMIKFGIIHSGRP